MPGGLALGVTCRLARAALFACFISLLAGCGNVPPEPPLLSGPARLRPADSLRVTAWSVDADGDSLGYRAAWGDGGESDWSPWVASGERAGLAHVYGDTGRFGVTARARDRKAESAESGAMFVAVYDYGPDRPLRPRPAADTVAVGDSLGCLSSAGHPLDERVALQFDWGDTLGGWTGYARPGEWLRSRHAYAEPGSYAIRARARDTSGHVSDWSDSTSVLVLTP